MFEGFVEQQQSRGLLQRLAAFALSSGLHVALVFAVIYVSVKVADDSGDEDVPVLFYAPPPPPPPPPPPAAVQQTPHRKKKRPKKVTLVQPVKEEIKPIEPDPEPEPEPEPDPEPEPEIEPVEGGQEGGVAGGVVGGVAGGTVGGVVGGVIGGQLGGQLPPTDEPVRLKRGMTPPKVIKSTMVEPEYPRMLRNARITGRVMLLLAIKRDGSVGQIKVRSGNPALAKAAKQAVRKWRFEPAEYEGKKIAVWLPFPFVFKLD